MSAEAKNRPRAYKLSDTEIDTVVAEDLFDAPRPGEVAIVEPGERAVEAAQQRGIVRRSILSWGGLLWSALGGLVSLAIGLWITKLVDDLFARSLTFGVIGLVLAGLVVLAVVALTVREIGGILRQRHIAVLHRGFAEARATDDRDAARAHVRELVSLYAARPETARARAHLVELTGAIVDGGDLVDIAESTIVMPLDLRVRREIAQAAKRVSVVTAIAPKAIIDVLFVAGQSIRLVRRIAEIYGGRPGLFGFVKLMRSVMAHLVITGGMAAGDTLLQQVVGHGIAAKLSARLGEGVLNGLLTTRVGLSAMAVCRPLPFADDRVPSVREVAPFLFGGEKE